MIDKVYTIEQLREFMEKEKINFLIIFSSDEYLNEYTKLDENSRYILTGFSGSTGDALVTPDKIFLFVDGRYHLQADEETDKNLVTVVKVGMDKAPQTALYEKIAELSDHSAKIGIISNKMSCGGFRKLLDILSEKNAKYKEFDFDPVADLVKAEKTESATPLKFIPQEISGLSAEKKLDLIIEDNEKNGIDTLVITKLEEIAYLTNLRGNEIPYSSAFKAKVIINEGKCQVFTDLNKISSEIKENLGVRFIFEEENRFGGFLEELNKTKMLATVGYDLNSMNLSDCRKLEKMINKLIEVKNSPVSALKSVKNSQELSHMKECFLRTDITVTRAISQLNQRLEHGEEVSEKDFSDSVKKIFFEEGAAALSFETIVASGGNTAFIHYTKADPQKFIKDGELVLLDCGAYFEGGYATDITRTFLAGGLKASADSKQKEVYTLVLRAFLNGINYPIDESSTGFDIDKKVREIIEKNKPEGFNFLHGTGHGIGISVHESPPRLGNSDFSKIKLQNGMCFTIEPGLYCDKWGGVRIENSVSIIDWQIKSLTKANLDDNLIDIELLTDEEKIWLEEYKKQAIG